MTVSPCPLPAIRTVSFCHRGWTAGRPPPGARRQQRAARPSRVNRARETFWVGDRAGVRLPGLGHGCAIHAAAVLYGVGSRLDDSPELLFRRRGADEVELRRSRGAG